MKWIVNDQLTFNGDHFLLELPGLTIKQIEKKIGKLPVKVKRSMKEKYSESIVLINDTEAYKESSFAHPGEKQAYGIYTLYTCFGEWRIGGYKGNKYVAELEEFLMS